MPNKTTDLPKKISIFDKEWNLTPDTGLEYEGSVVMGLTTYMDLEIKYRPQLPKNLLQDTIIHEIIHALSDEGQLEMTERQVSVLACSLLHTIKANPKIKEFCFD